MSSETSSKPLPGASAAAPTAIPAGEGAYTGDMSVDACGRRGEAGA